MDVRKPRTVKPGPKRRRCPWCTIACADGNKPPPCTCCHCSGYGNCKHGLGAKCSTPRYGRRLVCNACERAKLTFRHQGQERSNKAKVKEERNGRVVKNALDVRCARRSVPPPSIEEGRKARREQQAQEKRAHQAVRKHPRAQVAFAEKNRAWKRQRIESGGGAGSYSFDEAANPSEAVAYARTACGALSASSPARAALAATTATSAATSQSHMSWLPTAASSCAYFIGFGRVENAETFFNLRSRPPPHAAFAAAAVYSEVQDIGDNSDMACATHAYAKILRVAPQDTGGQGAPPEV